MDKNDFNQKISDISNAFLVARNKINAQDVNFKIVPKELKDPMGKFNAGKPITGAELQKISESWQSKDPLIDEEGNAFVLYISDWQYNLDRGKNSSEELPKYHVAWCKTLEYMQGAGRFKRYIKKTDIETNLFKGKGADDMDTQSVLYACKNCRGKMTEIHGYDIYFDVSNMDILKFFALYGKQDLLDSKTNRPYSIVYPRHWREISKKYREVAQWRCDECNNSFEGNKSMLDVHHINGVRSDVSKTNLRVLCKRCHSKQPMHSHYKPFIKTTGSTANIDKPIQSRQSITRSTATKSQMNKLENFLKQPERYATGTEKANQKVIDVIQSFKIIRKDLSKEKQEEFFRAMELYKNKLRNLRQYHDK